MKIKFNPVFFWKLFLIIVFWQLLGLALWFLLPPYRFENILISSYTAGSERPAE